MFTITSEDTKTAARTGELKTRHSILTTPLFLPIATKGTVKNLTPHELERANTQALIANAFLLYLRPGLTLIKKCGGLHKFIHWDRGIFTDSGGFQILSKQFLRSIDDNGVSFHNPYTRKNERFTPEKVMKIEETLGSDIAMTLDHVPPSNQNYAAVQEAVRRTHLWAQRCVKAHTDAKQLLFGITQGAIYKDLREKSAHYISSLNFDGIALGGFCIGEDKKVMLQLVKHSLRFIPKNKPRYLMGVGSPLEILESVSLGVDIFDSRYPTQNARHGAILTRNGEINLTKATYRADQKPLDPACACDVCKNQSRAFIHHLFRTQEHMAERYATHHNIHFLQAFMQEISLTIKEGRFQKFKKTFLQSYKP